MGGRRDRPRDLLAFYQEYRASEAVEEGRGERGGREHLLLINSGRLG
jgi:hypothetical protein